MTRLAYRLPFRIEYQRQDGSWVMETGNQDASLRYLEGYLTAYAERTPRLAARIVRDRDGRVMREVSASSRPEMGMVAGWPSPCSAICTRRRFAACPSSS